MGCDIHFHIEVKHKGQWLHYAEVPIDRNYGLFSVLAGVRGAFDPIVYDKGFPEDASVMTRLAYDYMGSDAHTPSWLNEDEIDMLRQWVTENIKDDKFGGFSLSLEQVVLKGVYQFGHSWGAHRHYDDGPYLPEGCTEVRFVFWFDN